MGSNIRLQKLLLLRFDFALHKECRQVQDERSLGNELEYSVEDAENLDDTGTPDCWGKLA